MVVHLIWLGKPSSQADKAAISVGRKFPRHDIYYHRNSDLVWPSWRGIYDKISGNLRMASDLLRHSLLRRQPGLYIDVDVVLRQDPDDLCCDWHTYTALMIEPTPYIGTDVLYVPNGWDRWQLFDDYISEHSHGNSFGFLTFAHRMLFSVRQKDAAAITCLRDRKRYPCAPADISSQAHVLRCGLTTDGLGDRVASALAAVGITKERVSKALGKPCGCAKRQQRLNELGRKLGIG